MSSEAHRTWFPTLGDTVAHVLEIPIPESRRKTLSKLVDFIQMKLGSNQPVRLNFICTHNSRRSQLAHVWAHVAAAYYGLEVQCASGGTETTAFYPAAIASLERAGFEVHKDSGENPTVRVSFSPDFGPVHAYSKTYDQSYPQGETYAAIMTCSSADEGCPFIPQAEVRLAIRYDDPKAFDGSSQEAQAYDESCLQIASEMFFVFSQIPPLAACPPVRNWASSISI